MKILLLRQYNPYVEIGASANRFCGLIDGLLTLGNKITIAVIGGIKYKSEIETFKSPNENLSIIYLSKRNNYSYWISRLNSYLLESLNILIIKNKLIKLFQEDFDLIWLTNSYQVLQLYLNIFEHINCKTFIELNEFNNYYKKDNSLTFFQKLKFEKTNKIFLKAVKKIDLFAVMTKKLIEHYRKLATNDAKFLHLPMTVDLSRFNIISEVSYIKPYIAYVGVLSNQKDGIDILIKSFSKISSIFPSYHLYLAGFNHYDVVEQKQLIKSLKLEERIHYLGILDRIEIPKFLKNASILALARPDSYQAQGGFPTKLGEYLATGNPVCATQVGEIPNYLKDNESAFMAIPGNVESFTDAMNRALNNIQNAKVVGKNGKKVAEENFSVEVKARRLSMFLNKNYK